MPNLNKKGPDGNGPMTGRKLGHCNPENKGKTDEEILQLRESSNQPTQGMRRGQGLGRGRQSQGLIERCKEFFGRGNGQGRGQGNGSSRGMGGNGNRCGQGRGMGRGRGQGLGMRYSETDL